MQIHASMHLKLLLFFILLLHFQSSVTAEELVFSVCGSSNYTSDRQYETNLMNTIFPDLSRNGAIRYDSSYYNNYGDGANTVYGYSQCMSGASEDYCRQCLINSTAEIIRRCPNKTEATIRYYYCILRYSYQPFFSVLNTTTMQIIYLYPVQNASNVTLFNTQVGGLMNNLTTAAASAVSKYAVNFTNYDSLQKIYGLAQCTRDLSESSCNNCLRRMIEEIPSCCEGRTGGNVYSVSCNIRYDMYNFFSLPPLPAPPPPPVAVDSPTPDGSLSVTGKKGRLIAIGFTVSIAGLVLLGCCIFYLLRRRSKPQEARKQQSHHALLNNLGAASTNLLNTDIYGGSQGENQELPFIDFGTIQHSTNNFSSENKLGQGGFGIVYKRAQLTWRIRHSIVNGIARGLLYLHEDSRLKVIHRDLKASNVLLDYEMNPKISDFGLARTFRENQGESNTNKVIGTYGYMAPEYAMDGLFSVKSDVFSFGVLLLEILSGRKNSRSYLAENAQSLLAYAWRLWCDQKVLELIDPILIDSCPMDEVLRFVHIGLLCIQEDATDRPTMSSVVLMLGSKSMTLPHPNEPPLYIRKREITSEESSSNAKTSSNNEFQASKHLKLHLFFILLLHFQSSITAEESSVTGQQPIYKSTFNACGSSNYTFGSQYHTIVNTILPTLSSNGVIRHDSFYNNSYGDGANTVYGYSQCMSGASEDVCRQCLLYSMADIIRLCPNKREATVRYYYCILRYSDQRFFSELDTTIRKSLYREQNAPNFTIFNTQVSGLLYYLATAAASAESKYAVNFTKYNSYGSIYGLAQCTRDLSESSCNDCLIRMIEDIPSCCEGRTGGNVYSVSCNIRYEIYSFFSLPPPPPPPRPPPPVAADSPTPAGSPIVNRTQGTARKQQSYQALSNNLGVASTDLLNTYICGGSQGENQELPFIDFGTIQHSTNNFSSENKLGQGGFGIVYKGMLADGKEIAVKRLSIGSSQGLKEFKNEVILISKLQHKNLVRLLFCCMENEEKLLIYEYMPNKSLDFFLFDQIKRAQLTWRIRHNIVNGIARGLLYLHEDSRLKVIHRDLKASNVLLDYEMNPKISDFGLARTFRENQGESNTNKVIGTYGYMAPEYAMDGLFSVKSDVFSFGVLLLEILSGRKNSRSYLAENAQSLLAYVWRLWCDQKVLELIDPILIDSCPMDEVLRFVHIGLLCIQEDATDRPTMSSVVLMLGSKSMTLPHPSEPPLYIRKREITSEESSSNAKTSSNNEVTISEIEPR
ncbi:Protein kinase domain-containing protein [Cinnamomum micranthum f. kanehirae]|uniref:non-specific serine/threonine protein kinase n=1 Tax=Cinnamomum micranthum f. kanehirae TaxID=337451 RepID=A0A3S3MRA5_9MAGN|nr:Protein kinase domain-containing protein [Cinnamomum micranthum f. kanehirae]